MVCRGEVLWVEEQSDQAADLRDGHGDQAGLSKIAAPFDSSWARMAVSAASAAMDRVMCRYQAS